MSPQRDCHAEPLPADWGPESWRERPALQLPQYPDPDELASALQELRGLPPLVTSWEVLALKQQLADAQEGKCFLLQGGDCAESFSDCSSDVISNRLKVLLQMSLVLVHGMRKPVVRVGRFAVCVSEGSTTTYGLLSGSMRRESCLCISHRVNAPHWLQWAAFPTDLKTRQSAPEFPSFPPVPPVNRAETTPQTVTNIGNASLDRCRHTARGH